MGKKLFAFLFMTGQPWLVNSNIDWITASVYNQRRHKNSSEPLLRGAQAPALVVLTQSVRYLMFILFSFFSTKGLPLCCMEPKGGSRLDIVKEGGSQYMPPFSSHFGLCEVDNNLTSRQAISQHRSCCFFFLFCHPSRFLKPTPLNIHAGRGRKNTHVVPLPVC